MPTVRQAWESGHYVFGPFPADGYWGSGSYKSFDATLALYHDQGLIPFKLLALEEGVNVTAGLPIIRTSPDHGTAFDIAREREWQVRYRLEMLSIKPLIFTATV